MKIWYIFVAFLIGLSLSMAGASERKRLLNDGWRFPTKPVDDGIIEFMPQGHDRNNKPSEPQTDILISKSVETLDSMYAKFRVDNTGLLRETYPFDDNFKATYLAGEDRQERIRYSYLWPYSGSLSALRALYEATGDSKYLNDIDTKVIPGLNHYYDTRREPAAYSSYINDAPRSDRFYDDNIWLGIDFSELYLLSGRKDYLDKALEIWKFIDSGTDSAVGGGIYWCEQKKTSKNTCSNAPGTVFAMRLYEATSDSVYLNAARNLYDWTVKHLRDESDCLYYDNVKLDGEIGKAKFAYNSGQMIEAAVLLYKATGEASYLNDAKNTAESALHYFFSGGTATDRNGSFPLLGKGNIWFTAVMMRGFNELDKIPSTSPYMDYFIRNLDFAWNSMRDESNGLFNEDWSGQKASDKKWLLTQAAVAEMYAMAADYRKRNRKV